MRSSTAKLWAKQNQHVGDRWRLFAAVAAAIDAKAVLYPGSYVDIAPSFVFRSVTYVDVDKRTPGFFDDAAGVAEIIARHNGPSNGEIKFVHADYTTTPDLGVEHFDLLISLYAGFVSEHCTQFLKVGGTLMVNSSHGDAAMASIDPRYELSGVIVSKDQKYRIDSNKLDTFLIPKKAQSISAESLHQSGRGVGYTRSPFAYLFTRVG